MMTDLLVFVCHGDATIMKEYDDKIVIEIKKKKWQPKILSLALFDETDPDQLASLVSQLT